MTEDSIIPLLIPGVILGGVLITLVTHLVLEELRERWHIVHPKNVHDILEHGYRTFEGHSDTYLVALNGDRVYKEVTFLGYKEIHLTPYYRQRSASVTTTDIAEALRNYEEKETQEPIDIYVQDLPKDKKEGGPSQ